MENSYGIGVRNRYELFYDEEVDPLELIKKTESKKNKKDKGAEKENQGKTAKTKDSVSGKKSIKNENVSKPIPEKASQTGNNNNNNTNITTTTTNNNNKQQQTQKPRSTERVKFSEREERNNQKNKPEEIKEPKETRENGAPQRFDESRGGRGGRGTGAPGGARGGRGARRGGRGGPGGLSGGSVGNSDFRGKREFDRQSGMVTSGVKPVDKRDGGGSYNWGSDKDQIEEQLQADHTTDLDTSGDNPEKVVTEEGGGGGGGGSGGSAAPAPASGEEDATRDEDGQREMTLDEWKALHKHEKPIFKTRRPGEGENTAQWKKTYVLKKKVDDQGNEEMIEVEVEEEEVHHGRKKVLLPIDFQFADTPTRGRGRGRGRGGGPGGRGRGEGGRGRGRGFSHGRFQAVSRQEAPKMDDERDFPSLG